MKTQKLTRFKASMLSLVLSGIAAMVAVFVLFFLGFVFHFIFGGGLVVRILTFSSYTLFIGISCFFICRHYPISVWFAPIICCASSIKGAVSEPDFWGPFFMYVIVWVVALAGAIVGYVIGRNRSLQV
jgi:hypothetical protein